MNIRRFSSGSQYEYASSKKKKNCLSVCRSVGPPVRRHTRAWRRRSAGRFGSARGGVGGVRGGVPEVSREGGGARAVLLAARSFPFRRPRSRRFIYDFWALTLSRGECIFAPWLEHASGQQVKLEEGERAGGSAGGWKRDGAAQCVLRSSLPGARVASAASAACCLLPGELPPCLLRVLGLRSMVEPHGACAASQL